MRLSPSADGETLFAALSEDDKKAVERAMNLTGTAVFAERCVNTLSGGEKRRVFLELLRELAEKHGKTVFVVMHDLAETVSIADDIAVLSEGKLMAYGEKNCILEGKIIEKNFEVRRFDTIDGGEKRIFFL